MRRSDRSRRRLCLRLLIGLIGVTPVTAGFAQERDTGEVMPPPRALFISGHSLTDRPIPDDLAAIAAGLGNPMVWGRRHLAGSTIRQRACIEGETGLATTQTSGDAAIRRYDALLVTEQHDLLGAFLWNDTIGQLAKLHDCFAARNPHGVSYFYVPWISLDDKGDPGRWVAYEQAAAPLWRCLVEAANRRSDAARHGNRIVAIAAASALAALIVRATRGAPIPGLTQADPRATVDLLIGDAVHATRLGSYFLALVTFAAMTGSAPLGAWAPSTVAPDLARALQVFAGQSAAEQKPSPMPDLDACAAHLREAAIDVFWPYMERAVWRPQSGVVGARFARLGKAARWRWMLWRDPAWSPFRAATPAGVE